MKKRKKDYDAFDENTNDGKSFGSIGWDMPDIDVDDTPAEPDDEFETDFQLDNAEDDDQVKFDTFQMDTDSTDKNSSFKDTPPVLSITGRINLPDEILERAAQLDVPKTEEIELPDDVMETVRELKQAEAEKKPQMSSVDDIPPAYELEENEEVPEPQNLFTVKGDIPEADEEDNSDAVDEEPADEDYDQSEPQYEPEYDEGEAEPEADTEEPADEDYEEQPVKSAKKKGFFARLFGKKDAPVDDVYGGLKRKDISELQKDYNPTGEVPMLNDTYSQLFDDSVDTLDKEVSENFDKIQRERRRRVAQAIENTGVDLDVMQDEFGVVAPPPVTAAPADPDAQDSVPMSTGDKDVDSFNKALMNEEKSRTMEIKLNTLNDTMELQESLRDLPKLDDDSANKIEEEAKIYQTAEIELPDDIDDDDAENASEDIDEGPDEFPSADSVNRYRPRTLPVHCIDLEALQEALDAEAADYDEETGSYRGRQLTSNQVDGLFEGVQETHTDDSEEIKADYTSPDEAKRISDELKAQMAKTNLKTTVSAAAAAVLFIAGLIFEGRNSVTLAIIYLILSLALVGAAAFFCKDEIINGLKSVIKFRANADSAAAVSCAAVCIQIIASFFAISSVASGTVHIYGALAAGILFLNSLGRLSLTKRVFANFRFMTSKDDKYAIRTYDDYDTSLKLAGDTAMGRPVIVYQRKAGFLKRYLELSFRSDPSQEASGVIAPYALVVSLLIGFITILTTKNPILGVSAVAAVACGTTIITNTIGINALLTKLSRKARKAGAMISGYEGIRQLSDANAVMVGESDLFPKGSVVINGLKIFNEDGLEENVLAASSLIRETGGTVADVFEQIITDTGAEVPKVTNIILEGENGVSGKVGEKQVLVGNRDILISHNITPPEREDIMKYLKGGKKALFIAVDGELKAMLVLTYNADKRRKLELQKLTENDVTLIVHSIDSNITKAFLSTLFDIPEARINVVHGDLGMSSRELCESEISRADASAATKGRVESLLSVMTMCIKERKIANLVVLIQYLGVILGLLITAIISVATGHAMSAFLLILFEAVWTAVVMLVPKFLNK